MRDAGFNSHKKIYLKKKGEGRGGPSNKVQILKVFLILKVQTYCKFILLKVYCKINRPLNSSLCLTFLYLVALLSTFSSSSVIYF
jgi:hypothetical protein